MSEDLEGYDLPPVSKCPGCGRMEIHKKCPAHGTPFYMSGIDYTPEIEIYIEKYNVSAEALIDIFKAVKMKRSFGSNWLRDAMYELDRVSKEHKGE